MHNKIIFPIVQMRKPRFLEGIAHTHTDASRAFEFRFSLLIAYRCSEQLRVKHDLMHPFGVGIRYFQNRHLIYMCILL